MVFCHFKKLREVSGQLHPFCLLYTLCTSARLVCQFSDSNSLYLNNWNRPRKKTIFAHVPLCAHGIRGASNLKKSTAFVIQQIHTKNMQMLSKHAHTVTRVHVHTHTRKNKTDLRFPCLWRGVFGWILWRGWQVFPPQLEDTHRRTAHSSLFTWDLLGIAFKVHFVCIAPTSWPDIAAQRLLSSRIVPAAVGKDSQISTGLANQWWTWSWLTYELMVFWSWLGGQSAGEKKHALTTNHLN